MLSNWLITIFCLNSGKERTIFFFRLYKRQLPELFQGIKKDSLEFCMGIFLPLSFFFFRVSLRFFHFLNPNLPFSPFCRRNSAGMLVAGQNNQISGKGRRYRRMRRNRGTLLFFLQLLFFRSCSPAIPRMRTKEISLCFYEALHW